MLRVQDLEFRVWTLAVPLEFRNEGLGLRVEGLDLGGTLRIQR